MSNVKFLHTYDLGVNISELYTIIVALEDRIKLFKKVRVNFADHDSAAGQIFDEKLAEMESMLERFKMI